MPSVQHVHVHAEHDAMTNDKAAERRSKLVGKIWLLHTCSALLRCKCVGASCSYPTAANRSSWRTNGFAMLMYDLALLLELLVQVWKLCSTVACTCLSCSEHVGTSIASAGRTPNGGASSGSAAAARLAGAGQRRRALCEI